LEPPPGWVFEEEEEEEACVRIESAMDTGRGVQDKWVDSQDVVDTAGGFVVVSLEGELYVLGELVVT
jgi:hypothetical protein